MSEQIDGWTAFSQSQAALDRSTSATTKLADNNDVPGRRREARRRRSPARLRERHRRTDAAAPRFTRHGRAHRVRPSRSPGPPPISSLGPTARARPAPTRTTAPRWDGSPLPADSARALRVEPCRRDPVGRALRRRLPGHARDRSISPTRALCRSRCSSSSPRRPRSPSDLTGARRRDRALRATRGTRSRRLRIVTQPSDTKAAEAALADVVKTLERQWALPRAATWRHSDRARRRSAAS